MAERVTQPAVDVAAYHAVERGAGIAFELVVADIPALGRAPGGGEALALEQFADRLEQGSRLGLAQAEPRGVEHGGVVAAEQPVRRRHQAPGALADGHAVGLGGSRGEGQGAVAAVPATGGGEGALVRRREAVGRAFVASRGLEPRQEARKVRQGEVAKHVPAGFRIVGSEGNEQVHGGGLSEGRRTAPFQLC